MSGRGGGRGGWGGGGGVIKVHSQNMHFFCTHAHMVHGGFLKASLEWKVPSSTTISKGSAKRKRKVTAIHDSTNFVGEMSAPTAFKV